MHLDFYRNRLEVFTVANFIVRMYDMKKEIIPSEICSDQPIHSLEDDLLGRGRFANAVANAIRHWREDQSLIVGLNGRWGTGKTSIKNMVVSLLENAENSPTIVNFNPWNWSGEDRLMSSFFEEIAVVLAQDSENDAAKNISVAWSKYATRLQLGGTALGHLKKAADFLGVPWIGFVFDAVAKSTTAAADVAMQAAETNIAPEQASLAELKNLLCKELSESDKTIVVAIDDIDRLTNEEIRLLFRLVRVNADFPKMIYLMLFDREIVEGALEEVSSGSGRNYLEKIVQVGFDVPLASQPSIDSLLFDGLERVLKNSKAEEFFDSDRWQQLYPDAIRPYFKTIRDVKRFLSAFSFSIGIFIRERELDVNFLDLLSLEVLRVFEPTVYRNVGKSSEWIVPSPLKKIGLSEPSREKLKHNVDLLVEGLTGSRKSDVERLLSAIFPTIQFALGGLHSNGSQLRWERSLRVCYYTMFERYFRFDFPDGEISIAQIRRLLSGLNREEIVKELKESHSVGNLKKLIQRLEAYSKSLRPEHVQAMVTAFLDIGDLIPRDHEALFFLTPERIAFQFLHVNAMQIPDHNSRSDKMLSCLRDTSGTWFPIFFVSNAEPSEEQEVSAWQECIFTEEGMGEAKRLMLAKIRSSKLLEMEPPKACTLLWRWKDWGGIEEPKQWLSDAIQEHTGALHVLAMLARKVRSSSGGSTRTYYEFDLSEVRHFVEPKTLLASLPTLSSAVDQTPNDEYAEQRKALDFAIKTLDESGQVDQ